LIHGMRTLVEVLAERGEYQPGDTGHRVSDRAEHVGRTYLEDKR
jgi:hypothetical protein